MGCAGRTSNEIQKIVLMRLKKKRKVLQAWKRWKDVKEIHAMIETGHVRFLPARSNE